MAGALAHLKGTVGPMGKPWLKVSIMEREPILLKIVDILATIETTRVEIGDTKGHFISSIQLLDLRNLLHEEFRLAFAVNSYNTILSAERGEESGPSAAIHLAASGTAEDSVRLERNQVAGEIKTLQAAIRDSDKSSRSRLNTKLGELLSRRAALDRAIKAIDKNAR